MSLQAVKSCLSLNSAKQFVCWKISGAVSSEVTVELLRNRLPQELLLIAKTGSSSDACLQVAQPEVCP